MGLLKAVRLDSTLAHLASARLPVGRCDRVLGLRCGTRTLWWLPRLPRWDSEPPLDTASSSSESASWCRARRCAVGRGTWGTRHWEASERLPPSLSARPPVRGHLSVCHLPGWAPHLGPASHPASFFIGEKNRDQEGKPLVNVTGRVTPTPRAPLRREAPSTSPSPLAGISPSLVASGQQGRAKPGHGTVHSSSCVRSQGSASLGPLLLCQRPGTVQPSDQVSSAVP